MHANKLNGSEESHLSFCSSFSPTEFLGPPQTFLRQLPPAQTTLSSYEQKLRFPTSFPISGLARLGAKPRLCRCSWRAFASTHPFMLPSTFPRQILFACPPTSPRKLRNPLFLPHAPALISLSHARVLISLTLTLYPLTI